MTTNVCSGPPPGGSPLIRATFDVVSEAPGGDTSSGENLSFLGDKDSLRVDVGSLNLL